MPICHDYTLLPIYICRKRCFQLPGAFPGGSERSEGSTLGFRLRPQEKAPLFEKTILRPQISESRAEAGGVVCSAFRGALQRCPCEFRCRLRVLLVQGAAPPSDTHKPPSLRSLCPGRVSHEAAQPGSQAGFDGAVSSVLCPRCSCDSVTLGCQLSAVTKLRPWIPPGAGGPGLPAPSCWPASLSTVCGVHP